LVNDERRSKKVIFSGDLGTNNKLVIRENYLQDADFIFIESTYGDRKHRPLPETINEFKTAIIESFKDGGNVVIPFALEKA